MDLLASTSGLPIPVDLPGLGTAGILVAVVLRLWWVERQDRLAAQRALLELTRASTERAADVAAAQRDLAEALDRLAVEVRRMDDRWSSR